MKTTFCNIKLHTTLYCQQSKPSAQIALSDSDEELGSLLVKQTTNKKKAPPKAKSTKAPKRPATKPVSKPNDSDSDASVEIVGAKKTSKKAKTQVDEPSFSSLVLSSSYEE